MKNKCNKKAQTKHFISYTVRCLHEKRTQFLIWVIHMYCTMLKCVAWKKHCYTAASSGSHWLNCYNILIINRQNRKQKI